MRALRNLSHFLSRLRRVRLGIGQYQGPHYDSKGPNMRPSARLAGFGQPEYLHHMRDMHGKLPGWHESS